MMKYVGVVIVVIGLLSSQIAQAETVDIAACPNQVVVKQCISWLAYTNVCKMSVYSCHPLSFPEVTKLLEGKMGS